MPFEDRLLNDGRRIPAIGFGSWKIPKDVCIGEVDQSIDVGFDHIDTAQAYRNEEEVGQAIKESGLARKDVWITSKWSGIDGKGCAQSCHESLEKLGVDYLDLYLAHSPRVTNGDIEGAWKKMEALVHAGKVKSIGVSNFSVADLKELLASCSIRPVVNQILLQPYVIGSTEPLLSYMAAQHIVPEGYSTLIPLTSKPGGPVDKPVNKLAKKYGKKPEQILLAWSRAKQAIIVTTSSRKERLVDYLNVGDIYLSDDEVKSIDHAGKKGELWDQRKSTMKTASKWTLAAGCVVYLGIRAFM